jgi:hypothetical protein
MWIYFWCVFCFCFRYSGIQNVDLALGHPRTAGLADADVFDYSKDVLSRPKPKQLFGPWYELIKKPFVGITSDGIVKDGLYELADECAPTQRMVRRKTLTYDVEPISY